VQRRLMRNRVEIEVDLNSGRMEIVKFSSKIDTISAAVWFVTTGLDFQFDPGPPSNVFTSRRLTTTEYVDLMRYVDEMRDRLDFIMAETVAPPS
jgi:hypothetical protein